VGGAWLLVACASSDNWRPGVSDRPQVIGERQRSPAQGSATPWAPLASVSAFPVVDDRRLPSSGHNPPYWSGVVRVNGALLGAYQQLGPGSAASAGAVALEAHYDLAGNAQQLFAMEKHEPGYDPGGGDWEYIVMSPDGTVESRGPLALCSRCHAESPHDHLFGPRISARRHIQQSGQSSGEPPSEADEDAGLSPDEGTPLPGDKKNTTKPAKKRKK